MGNRYKKLVYINYDEIIDIQQFPYLKYKNGKQEKKKKNIALEDRSETRRKQVTQRIYHLKTNIDKKNEIEKKGILFEVSSEIAFANIMNTFSYFDDKNNEINFVHIIEQKQMPMEYEKIFDKYESIVQENAELKQKPSISVPNIDKTKLIQDFFKEFSQLLFPSVKKLNQIKKDLNDIEIKDLIELNLIKDEIGNTINEISNIMISTKKRLG